jgi:formate hydrogenlyase transcriptional activator
VARTLEQIERDHILSVLESVGWRVGGDRGAARVLGLKRTTLEARMTRLGIARPGASPRPVAIG